MKEQLIIIGNGFDLDHGLDTSYAGFKKYLLNNKYRDACKAIPSPILDHHGEVHFNDDELKNFLLREIQGSDDDDKWSDFEERLGWIDFSDYLVDLPELGNEWHDAEDNEYNMNDALLAFPYLTKFFIEWLNDVIYKYEYNEVAVSNDTKAEFTNLLTKNTKILNFNYTMTVENLYNFYSINHIHGMLKHENIILGHSQSIATSERFIGADNSIIEIEQSLYKNTDCIINENIDFFENLCDVEEIYTYGFSFSDVDMPYIIEIIKNISSKATWFLHGNKYEVGNKNNYTKKLKSNGFAGKIKEWP